MQLKEGNISTLTVLPKIKNSIALCFCPVIFIGTYLYVKNGCHLLAKIVKRGLNYHR